MAAKKSYSGIDRFNHWIVAFAVVGLIIVGWTVSMDLLGDGAARELRNTHKAVGVLVLFFAVWRVGWRLVNGFAEPDDGIPVWQAKVSKAAHYTLLLCIIVMPITGILNGYFGGRSAKVFGLFEIAPAAEKSPDLKELFSNAHMAIGIVLTVVVTLHIAAALKHHFVDGNSVLKRMTSGS